jgi:hypothetical protein
MRSASQGYGIHRVRPDIRPGLYSFDHVVHTLDRVLGRGNTTETESSVACELRAIWPKPLESAPRAEACEDKTPGMALHKKSSLSFQHSAR